MTLPTVLAGPVVRRVAPDRAVVWLASSVPLPGLAIEVYEIPDGWRPGSPTPAVPIDSQAVSVQLGSHLWVHLVAALPQPPRGLLREPTVQRLPTDVLLAYDLTSTNGTSRKLADLLTLSDAVLPPLPLPTFWIPDPSRHRLHALTGSCRKLHGPGSDMMQSAQALLIRTALRRTNRPSVLLLGGDQIYADDVADLLARHVNGLAQQLMGWNETVPDLPRPDRIAVRARQRLVKQHAGFTSGHAHNHLLTFGEFAAMYCLAWNADLWPLSWPSVVDLWTSIDRRERPRAADMPREHAEGVRRLRAGRDGSRAARRVLANAATYMVFDDHEVTDDWNLNARWERNVYGTRAGRRIVANGLAAYWAFQAWGNDPAMFPSSFVSTVPQFTAAGQSAGAAETLLLNHHRWAYATPTAPTVVALNTRTGRGSTRAPIDVIDGHARPRNNRAPRLLGAEERARTRQLLRSALPGPLVLLIPSPVVGAEWIEAVQGLIGWLSPSAGDVEAWAANPRNVLDFADLVAPARPDPLVVVSGDVHYGFEAAVRLETPSRTVQMAQLCSSALKNHPEGGLAASARILGAKVVQSPHASHWWAGDSGPIVRTTPAGAVDEVLVLAQRAARGRERLISRSKFQLPAGSTPLVGSVLALDNNLGELVVANRQVRHRLWRERGGGRAEAWVDWRSGSWPV